MRFYTAGVVHRGLPASSHYRHHIIVDIKMTNNNQIKYKRTLTKSQLITIHLLIITIVIPYNICHGEFYLAVQHNSIAHPRWPRNALRRLGPCR